MSGAPAVPLSAPALGDLERRYLLEAFDSGWISGTGPFVRLFEERLASRAERAHAVSVNSGTAALEAVLQALGVAAGDEVIVPALTFAAPAAAVLNLRASPVLCDIDPVAWTLDPVAAGKLVTPRTRAVIAVDLLGHPADFDALADLGVPVIEDAAQAHGAAYRGRPAGTHGVASVFSFHANKAVSTGEGGCVVTDDGELARRVRLIANHAMTPDRPYRHDMPGRNLRMTNLTAAIGAAQVERWDELVSARNAVAAQYTELLAGCAARPRPAAPWADPSCWLFAVTSRDRDAVVAHMADEGIDARAIWPPLSELPLYAGRAPIPCPVAAEVSATTLWLPTWAHMPRHDIRRVAGALRSALAAGA